MTTTKGAKIKIENFTSPGKLYAVDAAKYEAMKAAYLKVVSKEAPGLTQAEIRQRVTAHLPADLFPGGATAGWWAKAVQLDLEAKRIISRSSTSPLRMRKN
jgi:hypothetical protein